jgi:hypothetical protein
MFLSIALAAPLLLASAAQSSTTSAPQSAPAAPFRLPLLRRRSRLLLLAKPAKDADPMICELCRDRIAAAVQKVCMRKSDWEEQRQQNQRLIERARRRRCR